MCSLVLVSNSIWQATLFIGLVRGQDLTPEQYTINISCRTHVKEPLEPRVSAGGVQSPSTRPPTLSPHPPGAAVSL